MSVEEAMKMIVSGGLYQPTQPVTAGIGAKPADATSRRSEVEVPIA
jgi:uncharacterized membrane protein